MPRKRQKTPQLRPSSISVRHQKSAKELQWQDLEGSFWTKEFYRCKDGYQLRITFEGHRLNVNKFSHRAIESLVKKRFEEYQVEMVDTFADESSMFLISAVDWKQCRNDLEASGCVESDYNLDYSKKKKRSSSLPSKNEDDDVDDEQQIKEKEEEKEPDEISALAEEEEEQQEEEQKQSRLQQEFSKLISLLGSSPQYLIPVSEQIQISKFSKEIKDFELFFYWNHLFSVVQMGTAVRKDLLERISNDSSATWFPRPHHREDESICDGCGVTKFISGDVVLSDSTLQFGSGCSNKISVLIQYYSWLRRLISFFCQPGLGGKSPNFSLAYHLYCFRTELDSIVDTINHSIRNIYELPHEYD